MRVSAQLATRLQGELARRFLVDPDCIRLLGTHQNLIFGCHIGPQHRILRLSVDSTRSLATVRAELDWIEYLRAEGFPAVRPLPCPSGREVEIIQIGRDVFFLTCFEFLPGLTLDKVELTDDLCRKWGSLVGLSHRLTRSYSPREERRRPTWYEMPCFAFKRYVPPAKRRLIQRCEELFVHLRKLSTQPADYGLIHADLHPGNLVVDSERSGLRCLDFDDSHYNWFVYDIATAIFFAHWRLHHKPNFLAHFLDCFMDGYSSEHRPPADWIRNLPEFLRLRELAKCVIYHRTYVLQNNRWDYSRLPDRQSRRLSQIIEHLEVDREYIPGLSSLCACDESSSAKS